MQKSSVHRSNLTLGFLWFCWKKKNVIFFFSLQTKLECELDEAISDKDFKLAESLSNEITKRKFATQVNSALDAKKHTKMKEEKERTKHKKRRKLKWAFDHKERWETKGNMWLLD